jgi:RNA polymerase sigma-70 factor (ECF subfamily)
MERTESIGGLHGPDRDAEVEAIVAEHEKGLLRYAARIVNDPNAAQDVVQNVFIKLCRSWQDGAKPAPQMKSWLYRVTHNAAVDYIRSESRLRGLHERQAEDLTATAPAHQRRTVAAKDAMQIALEHLRRLKPEEQQVVILRIQDGMSYREIAEITKRSEGNVGCVLHHALKTLAQSLKRDGVTWGGD